MFDTEGREVLLEKWFGNIGDWQYDQNKDLYPHLTIHRNGRHFILRVNKGHVLMKRGVRFWTAHIIEVVGDVAYFAYELNLGIEYYQDVEMNKCQKLAFKIATRLIRNGTI